MMPLRHWLVASLALLAPTSVSCTSRLDPPIAVVTSEPELQLAPGEFAGFAKTALGKPVTFQNDIYSATCHPLFAITGWSQDATGKSHTGTILMWLHRAHVAAGRVFVEPCELTSPFSASPSTVVGLVSSSWFEAAIPDADSAAPPLRRLQFPGWSEFSNPAFCGRQMAFWALSKSSSGEGADLTATVADLFGGTVIASQPLGNIALETDNRWCLRRPTWTSDCQAATFDAAEKGSHVVRTNQTR